MSGVGQDLTPKSFIPVDESNLSAKPAPSQLKTGVMSTGQQISVGPETGSTEKIKNQSLSILAKKREPLPPLPPSPEQIYRRKGLPPVPQEHLSSVPQEPLPSVPQEFLPSVPQEPLPSIPQEPLPSDLQEPLPGTSEKAPQEQSVENSPLLQRTFKKVEEFKSEVGEYIFKRIFSSPNKEIVVESSVKQEKKSNSMEELFQNNPKASFMIKDGEVVSVPRASLVVVGLVRISPHLEKQDVVNVNSILKFLSDKIKEGPTEEKKTQLCNDLIAFVSTDWFKEVFQSHEKEVMSKLKTSVTTILHSFENSELQQENSAKFFVSTNLPVSVIHNLLQSTNESFESLPPSELLQKSKKLFEGVGYKFVLDSEGEIGFTERKRSIGGTAGKNPESGKAALAFLQLVTKATIGASSMQDLKDLSDTLDTLSKNDWFVGTKEHYTSVSEAFSSAEKIIAEKQEGMVKEAISRVQSEPGQEAIRSFSLIISKVRPDVLEKTYAICETSDKSKELLKEWKKETIRRSFVEGGKSGCSGMGAMAHCGKGVFDWTEVLDVMESLDKETLNTILKDFVDVYKNKFSEKDRRRLQDLSIDRGIPINLPVEVKLLIREFFVEGRKSSYSEIMATAHREKGVFDWNDVIGVMKSLDNDTLKTVLKDFVDVNKNKFSEKDRESLQALSKEKGIPIDFGGVSAASDFQNNALKDNGQKYQENVEEAASCLFAQSAAVYLGSDMSGLGAGSDAGGEFKLISNFSNQVTNSVISSLFEGVGSKNEGVGSQNDLTTIHERGKFWGDVLEKCREKGDICSAMSIYAAFNNSSVSRMYFKNRPDGTQEPREGVSDSVLNALNKFSIIANTEKSNASQRNLYEERKELPCIPYFGIFLTDATFIKEGNEGKNLGSRIPMSGKIVEENRLRQTILQETVSTSPKSVMQLVDAFNEDAMYEKSQKIVPRGS